MRAVSQVWFKTESMEVIWSIDVIGRAIDGGVLVVLPIDRWGRGRGSIWEKSGT